jgi:hypothetical protein
MTQCAGIITNSLTYRKKTVKWPACPLRGAIVTGYCGGKSGVSVAKASQPGISTGVRYRTASPGSGRVLSGSGFSG